VHILEEAQRRAEKVLEEARNKASQIISDAKLNGEQLQKQLAEMIDEADKNHVGEYKQKLQKISEDIENNFQKEASELRQMLETEKASAQKNLASKMEAEYARLHQELENFRNQRLAEIEAGLGEAVEAGLKKAVGGMVNVEGHNELIMMALEEVKKQDVFKRG
jgi:F0F1-type ATP synthase membrane subunit b/b'